MANPSFKCDLTRDHKNTVDLLDMSDKNNRLSTCFHGEATADYS